MESPININIVSLALNLPGPVAIARLQQLGATVIKIEPPEGDPLKQFSPEWYQELIAGQKVVTLNLKTVEHRSKLNQYLENADLLITSMRPQALERLNLEQGSINSQFPHLSHIEITGYPNERENRTGNDLNYQAELGLVTPPALPRTLFADLITSEKVFSATLLQIILKKANNKGVYQKISIVESLASCLLPIQYEMTTEGNILGGGFAGYNLYQTSDGWIALAALESHFWIKLTNELGLENADTDSLKNNFLRQNSEYWHKWGREKDLPITEVV